MKTNYMNVDMNLSYYDSLEMILLNLKHLSDRITEKHYEKGSYILDGEDPSSGVSVYNMTSLEEDISHIEQSLINTINKGFKLIENV
jgi:hypothetical protein